IAMPAWRTRSSVRRKAFNRQILTHGHYTGAMEAIEIQTGSKPAASIIWLHGLGADGHDFEPIVPELKLAKAVRFVFPHAPVRPVTINQGMRMRARYRPLQFGCAHEDGDW